jgi:diguanylate cyclase (GGDEF)-like protein
MHGTYPAEPALPKKTGWQGIWPNRIGRRLALGFGTLVALMLLDFAVAGYQLRQVNNLTSQFAQGDMQRLLRVQSLSVQTEGVGSALIRLMNAPRENRVAEYTDVDGRNRQIDNIIESLNAELKDPGQEETLQRLKVSRARYAQAFIATVDQVEAGDLAAAARELNGQINPALKAMLQESSTLLQRERQRIELKLDDAQRLFRLAAAWVTGLSIFVVMLAAWLAWKTTQSVVVPLSVLELAAYNIAAGDYTINVPSTGTAEMDRVGLALSSMAQTVAQREHQIVRLAYEDPLTGLPNRTAFLQPAKAANPHHNCVALLDLARLKVINETLGHNTGDTLIKQLGQRAASVFKASAYNGLIGLNPTVARLSGGTFAASFFALDRAAVEALRMAVDQALKTPVICGVHSVDLNLTSGYADIGSQEEIKSIETLMRNAEVALHSAKRSALDYAWYSEEQEAARLDHLSLVSDLRNAVAASQLQMWLQPKFSLVSGKAVGAEALVRWQHPTRGFVSPAEFVPFAEQTGYITMVTDWMLREALRTLVQWTPTHPELSIAVNVSTRDLQDATFAKRVAQLLADSDVAPERLRIEITESGLMEDAQHSVALLHDLRAIGIQLSIDDFGTGYSSLAYLQKLPVSELKIDRAFVDKIDTAPGTQKLVRAMIEMGHGLDLMVTAEGVETQAEREVLAALGCDVMQGYFASRPLHGPALQAWYDALPVS